MATITGFSNEREGQYIFYKDFLARVDRTLTPEDVIVDDNDGVLNGNLLEFKKVITDLNSALFQAIRYLSARRIKGKPIPANILLISLTTGKAYLYKSQDYLEDIEKVYIGAASKGTEGYAGNPPLETLDYHKNIIDEDRLIKLLRENNFIKINIDENCIVGWARSFYSLVPGAKKSEFIGDLEGKVKIIGEIREPEVFKDYIYPYTKRTNAKFRYLMDRLNDNIQKKNLGAFYTPRLYADKSLELVREAIARVPEGNDYIILDRCAGTGNLQYGMTKEELKHVILSTIEYYEYKVLCELLGDKVRHIIPPTEREDTFVKGNVRGADALSKEYVNNPIIKQYIDNPKCTIILFENPPYAETTSIEHQRHGASVKSSVWKQSFVVKEMKKEVKGTVSNDLGNAFIWSAFKYYLRQPTDSYVVYSPVKYWKAQHLIDRQFIKGFAFNRRFFHTNIDACIMVALWVNEVDESLEELALTGFNIEDGYLKQHSGLLPVKRIHQIFSKTYYDKRPITQAEEGIACSLKGLEFTDKSRIRINPLYSPEIIGYMVANGINFDNPDINTTLLRAGQYNGNGFYLRSDNYLEKLPMFAAGRYITYNRAWTERARIMKSGDGADRFHSDLKAGKLHQFLLKTLLFTVLEAQNHMRTFMGSDGRFYRNELCFDTTNGDTIASRDIKSLNLNKAEKELLCIWDFVLKYAKTTKGYDSTLTYGVYQISDELNTFDVDPIMKSRKYHCLELQTYLTTLKQKVREYYNSEIVPVLFEYEFLK